MTRQLKLTKFRNLSLLDPFFDSLKEGYDEFPDWFQRKADEDVYVVVDDVTDELSGMLYLKVEDAPIKDVTPQLPDGKWLKVGTLKIVGRGTRLGERILKKIFDTAISKNADGVYVTVFEVHEQLISLFERYGFVKHRKKITKNGTELVLVRDLRKFSSDIIKDYPFIHTKGKKYWLLAIYPDYHTELFPDSILRNEPKEMIQDVSHTNTIHKTYISGLSLTRMSPGDIVLFYRTTDHVAPAYFRSVVTSVCVVEEIKRKSDFKDFEDFVRYNEKQSVFSRADLFCQWAKERLYVAKLTYNAAFGKRIIRGRLLDDGIISEQPQWDLRSLSYTQLSDILKLGEVNARLIID